MRFSMRINGLALVFATLGSSLLPSNVFSADSTNFDTAWTYVYDGGKSKDGSAIGDDFRDVKILPNGDAVCVGDTRDTSYIQSVLITRLSPSGKVVQTKLHRFKQGEGAASLLLAKNGDYVIGGYRSTSPLFLRFDSALNEKSASWYYDSVANRLILSKPATINSMLEADDGRIIATAGDVFPNNNNQNLNNYAAYIEYDAQGVEVRMNEFLNTTGYEIAGWSIAESPTSGGVLLGGKQSLFKIDTTGNLAYKRQYSFSLPGVGTEVNNVSRVHHLRSGPLMVVGQSYEEDCWTRYNRLSYDAWWSTLSGSGTDDARFTAGVSGQDDYLYDFAQLVDGRIAFVGGKGTVADSGLWVFVTDSTGKTVQWEKQYNLPGLVNGTTRSNILPLSIAATPDSGFVLVGMEGSFNANANACAFKFLPKPLPVSNRLIAQNHVHNAFRNGARTFSFETKQSTDVELLLYTVQGKLAGRYTRHVAQAGPVEIRIAPSQLKTGMYLWKLHAGRESLKGFFTFTE